MLPYGPMKQVRNEHNDTVIPLLFCLMLTAPSSARNLTATPGRNDVVLMWLPPTQLNGNVSYSYTIRVTRTNTLITNGVTTDLDVTIYGLNAYTGYRFTVVAVTLGGSSNSISTSFVTQQGSMLIIIWHVNQWLVANYMSLLLLKLISIAAIFWLPPFKLLFYMYKTVL